MADLLECLLQIKGLRETVDRVTALAGHVREDRWNAAAEPGGPTARELLARLADLEGVYGSWLRLMIAAERPILPPIEEAALAALARFRDWTSAVALDRFVARRSDNLELLDRCSADDLARVAEHPVRRRLTVADVVATMLASDFERLAAIRRALGV